LASKFLGYGNNDRTLLRSLAGWSEITEITKQSDGLSSEQVCVFVFLLMFYK